MENSDGVNLHLFEIREEAADGPLGFRYVLMYVPSESNLLKGVLQSRVFQGLFSVYIAFEKAGIVEPFLRIENGIRAEGAYSLKATQVQIEELDFVLSI